jgi:hypothetical protein
MTTDSHRRTKAYTKLRQLTAAGNLSDETKAWTPAWSSQVLEVVIKEIISQNDGSVRNVFAALWELGGQSDVPLTRTMANFIKDIVVLIFTQYRSIYDSDDFSWMADRVRLGCTPPQAYLAALSLPDFLIETCRSEILSSLSKTGFHDEVEKMF